MLGHLSCGLQLLSKSTTYSPFTLHTQNSSVSVWTGSLASVNTHGTVLSRTVPHGMVPHTCMLGGPDQYKRVPLSSVNSGVPLMNGYATCIIFSELIDIQGAVSRAADQSSVQE